MSEQSLSPESVAARSGASLDFVRHLLDLGIIAAEPGAGLTEADVRRVRVVESLDGAGLSLDGLAEALRSGLLSLDFVEQPAYDRYASLLEVTFGEIIESTGVPLDLLATMREAMGGAAEAHPEDRVRETELPIIRLCELILRNGVRPEALARSLRVSGESLRRMAETESDWWGSDILAPLFQAGVPPAEVGRRTATFASELSSAGDAAILAGYHAHQANAWMRNILEGFEAALTGQGLPSRVDRPPAIAFLDISGYTRLTEERGDEAALDLATALGRIVHRSCARHGGRTVKWLGDGVMSHFPEPARSVVACLEMVAAVAEDGLPPAHVGISSGPVLTQQGDYFGRTVNAAARIAEYARQGEVLVTEGVVEASRALDGSVAFELIGPVELKGLSGALSLYRATRAQA